MEPDFGVKKRDARYEYGGDYINYEDRRQRANQILAALAAIQ